ncbi:MAG: DUF4065 domain-containing protein [Deltaproteobacteria bacterium]|nr:DUF4065 domain-containing protein [Deltaproteobacteria bacterium]
MTDNAMPVPAINSAIAVANWFIGQNAEQPSGLTHLKLQKMLYLAQGWHLAYFDVPLFEDPIEAWKYGPVVRSVYFALRSRAKNEIISAPIEGYVFRGGVDYEPLGTPEMVFRDDSVREFMESVWDTYREKSAWQLVGMTHAKGSPWDTVANSPGGLVAVGDTGFLTEYFDSIIPTELMRAYFKSYLSGDV